MNNKMNRSKEHLSRLCVWPMRKKKTLKLKFFLCDSISLQDCDEFVHFLIITIIISSPIINQAPPREKPLNQKRPPAVALIVCLILENNDEVKMTKVATLASNTVSASAW